MDIKLINYFLTVVEEKSITAAAKKLHISQPPLSRQMKNLEDEIGTPLFFRNKNEMTLTDAGNLLQKRGVELVRLFRLTQLELKEMGASTKEKLTIGSYGTANAFILSSCVDLLTKKLPNIEVHIVYGAPEDITAELRNGKIDIGFIRTPFDDMGSFDILTLYTGDLVVAIPNDHPLAASGRTGVSIEELSECRLIVPSRAAICRPLTDLFASYHKTPNIVCYYCGLENAIALTEKGIGVSICPRFTDLLERKWSFVIKNIEATEIKTSFAVIRKKNRGDSDRLNHFWKLLQKHFDESGTQSDTLSKASP